VNWWSSARLRRYKSYPRKLSTEDNPIFRSFIPYFKNLAPSHTWGQLFNATPNSLRFFRKGFVGRGGINEDVSSEDGDLIGATIVMVDFGLEANSSLPHFSKILIYHMPITRFGSPELSSRRSEIPKYGDYTLSCRGLVFLDGHEKTVMNGNKSWHSWDRRMHSLENQFITMEKVSSSTHEPWNAFNNGFLLKWAKIGSWKWLALKEKLHSLNAHWIFLRGIGRFLRETKNPFFEYHPALYNVHWFSSYVRSPPPPPSGARAGSPGWAYSNSSAYLFSTLGAIPTLIAC